jgi:hypothetical protein
VPRHHSLLRRATRFSAKQFRFSLGSVKRERRTYSFRDNLQHFSEFFFAERK